LLIKHVARDKNTFRESWGNALCTTGVLSTAFLVLVLFGAHLVLPREIPRLLVFFIGLSDMLLVNIVNLAGQAFQAFERLHMTSRMPVVLIGARVTSALVLILINHHPTAMLWSGFYLAGTTAAALYALGLTCWKLGWPTLGLGSVRRDALEGFYFSVSLSSQSIYNNIDKAMLTRFSTLDAVGIYATAYRVVDMAFQPVFALLASTYARFFQYGQHGLAGTTRFARRLLPFSVGYGALSGIGLVLVAPILPIILGRDYANAVEALFWLSPIVLMRSVHYFLANSLTGAGYQGTRTAVQLVIAAQNVLLNLWLIPAYGWRGAAWASLASDGLLGVYLGLMILLLSRKAKLSSVACSVEPGVTL
jgi:O-antigen/teichoic acid export membrane protein